MWPFAICCELDLRNHKRTHTHSLGVFSITSLQLASLSGIVKLRLLGFKSCSWVWSGPGPNMIWDGTWDMIRLQRKLCKVSKRFTMKNFSIKHPCILEYFRYFLSTENWAFRETLNSSFLALHWTDWTFLVMYKNDSSRKDKLKHSSAFKIEVFWVFFFKALVW